MYIYKNALCNLWRNKGRSILVAVIYIIVLTSITLSLVLCGISDTMLTDYQNGFGIETRIITDWEYAETHAITEEVTLPDGTTETTSSFEAEEITIAQYDKFAQSQYVRDAVLAAATFYCSENLNAIPMDKQLVRPEGMTTDELMQTFEVSSLDELLELFTESELDDIASWKSGVLGQIWGYTDIKLSNDFFEGKRKIIEGRCFENDGEVIVGEKFANLNNIHVGDTIEVTGGKKTDNKEHQLTVVGIFIDYETSVNSGDIWLGVNANDIIVSYKTLRDMELTGVFPISDEIKFYLTYADAPNKFLSELRENGLPESYKLQYDLDEYNKKVEPIDRMKSFAILFGTMVLGIGITILVFLSIINVRERKYEIGVLRSIGMTKAKLIRSMIYESVTLVLVCALIGLPAGYFLSRIASQMFVDIGKGVIIPNISFDTLFIILIVSCLLVAVSCIVSALAIVKCEPMKILNEQN